MDESDNALTPENLNKVLNELIDLGYIAESNDGRLIPTQKGIEYAINEGLVGEINSKVYPLYELN